MSKPNIVTNKAALPYKPMKVIRQGFKMDLPDEKQSGMYNMRKRTDDEEIESMDTSNDKKQFKKEVDDLYLGPQKMIELQKNLED